MLNGPVTLDHEGIARRIPHAGSMCLLARLERWTIDTIHCSASGHCDAQNPLRCEGVLLAPAAIEYASQAMALHGTLCATDASVPVAGFLASVRGMRLRVPRLDEIEGELQVAAQRLAGDANQALYAFTLHDDRGRLLVDGRATVILNALP